MAIKPSGFPPLPHSHGMGEVTGLNTEMGNHRNAFAGAASRYYAPFCRIVKNGDQTIPNATDTWMTTNWTTLHDNANMVKLYGTDGINFLRVVVPISGFYDIHWSAIIDGTGTSAISAAVVLDGGNVVNNSIINAQGASNGWAKAHANDVVYLPSGSWLFFACWQGSGASKSLKGTWFGGSRTQITVEWIGR